MTAEPAIRPTVVQRVTSTIEDMIADGRLCPGDHVSEPSVALHLGISRGPVREACRALIERGLLVTHANRGCFVRELSVRDIVDLYEVRAALARLAGRTLAERITPAQQAELTAIVDQHEAAAQVWDLPAMQRLNVQFHDRIVEFSGNARLRAIEATMERELAICRRRSTAAVIDAPPRNAEHRAIITALLARDVEAAGAALEHHILNSKTRFIERL
ncbi:GntR family transcriptional regulator [Acidisphaera sp. L21]|uniref:GntR family transcriptional regulator n=1 Tax=Acidisphaera sp. L21 TaxID=1641851 RepID=UPI00131CDD0B|nr:FCD domain-containing protein [Acidisphaera sp. L21]